MKLVLGNALFGLILAWYLFAYPSEQFVLGIALLLCAIVAGVGLGYSLGVSPPKRFLRRSSRRRPGASASSTFDVVDDAE